MRIFILDDSRSIEQAIDAVSPNFPKPDLVNDLVLARPFRWDGEKIIQSLDDAFELIANQPPMDIWILDNDLGSGLEGYDFLKQMCEQNPCQVASLILSCSANPAAKKNIETYGRNWNKKNWK